MVDYLIYKKNKNLKMQNINDNYFLLSLSLQDMLFFNAANDNVQNQENNDFIDESSGT